MTVADRFERISDLLGYYGYETRHAAGSGDGTDWEVTYILAAGSSQQTRTVAAPTEEGLYAYLAKRLPEDAVRDWRAYAFLLEGEIAQLKRSH